MAVNVYYVTMDPETRSFKVPATGKIIDYQITSKGTVNGDILRIIMDDGKTASAASTDVLLSQIKRQVEQGLLQSEPSP